MSEIQVASRYAKSLIDLAQEQNALESVRGSMELFAETLHNNPQLQAVLKNPIVGLDKKANILNGLFASKVNPLVLAFFKIMVNKGRSAVLYATAKEFVNAYNLRKNITKATVVSAVPLSAENKKQMEEVIKQSTQGDVILDAQVDAALIGGFVLKVGDKQFDASLANQLNKLKKEFKQNA